VILTILQLFGILFGFFFRMTGGELFYKIARKSGPLPEHTAKSIFRKLLSAIHYLHEMGVAHCDLKEFSSCLFYRPFD